MSPLLSEEKKEEFEKAHQLLPEEKKEEFEDACRDMDGKFSEEETLGSSGKRYSCKVNGENSIWINLVEFPDEGVIGVHCLGGNTFSTVSEIDEINVKKDNLPSEHLSVGSDDVEDLEAKLKSEARLEAEGE